MLVFVLPSLIFLLVNVHSPFMLFTLYFLYFFFCILLLISKDLLALNSAPELHRKGIKTRS